jgi:molybdopterin synthase sulfur carrier subunit
MTVHVLYFGGLREALGCGSEEVALAAATGTVAALRDQIAARGGTWRALSEAKNLRAAVNQTMVDFEAAIAAGDEVAFFPPVTGG